MYDQRSVKAHAAMAKIDMQADYWHQDPAKLADVFKLVSSQAVSPFSCSQISSTDTQGTSLHDEKALPSRLGSG